MAQRSRIKKGTGTGYRFKATGASSSRKQTTRSVPALKGPALGRDAPDTVRLFVSTDMAAEWSAKTRPFLRRFLQDAQPLVQTANRDLAPLLRDLSTRLARAQPSAPIISPDLLRSMVWTFNRHQPRVIRLSPPVPAAPSLTPDSQPLTAAEEHFLRTHGGDVDPTSAPDSPKPIGVTVLGTPEVANMLAVSAVTVTRRAHARRLLAYDDHGRFAFPLWQFTPSGEPLSDLDEVLPGVPPGWGPYRIEQFFTTPDGALDDMTPADWISAGRGALTVMRVLDGESRA